MSVHVIFYQQGHKMMEAVATEEAYRRYRDSQAQQRWVETIRHPKPETDVSAAKRKLVQFNYSCLPTEDGCLKGAKRLSKSVGMDIDHLSVDEVNLVAATAIEKKDELGLLMLERSARGGGLHVVFRRHPEMDQEANLRWASDLLGVEYDAGAKDITRVFFATTSEDLLYLHEDLFDNAECEASTGSATATKPATKTATEAAATATETTQKGERKSGGPTAPMASETTSAVSETVYKSDGQSEEKSQTEEGETTSKEADETPTEEQEGHTGEEESEEEKPLRYKGIPYDRIIEKWWTFYNDGEHPIRSNRNTLTFELAVNLRHICGFDRSVLDRVIPCYDGFAEAEKLSCIDSALGERKTQMPRRLKEVVEAVRQDMIVEGREVDSIDEAMAGYCSHIEVTICADGSIVVEDDGRGITVDEHKKLHKCALEVVMTVLHAGGKFDKGSYKVSGGLHGVGVSCVNALSTHMMSQVFRDGNIYQQEYAPGKPLYPVKIVGKTDKHGTRQQFWPDGTIFTTTTFKWEIIERRMRELDYLNAGERMTLTDEKTEM